MYYKEESDSFVLETFPVGVFQVNTTVIYHKKTHEGLIIDPGNLHTPVKDFVHERKISLKLALHTHGHADHTGRSSDLNIPLYLHRDDLCFYEDSRSWGEKYREPGSMSLRPIDHFYTDQEMLSFFDLKVRVIFSPGHSPGSVGLYMEHFKPPILFSGDTLFCENVGRTDLEKGDFSLLEKSVKERFYTLPDETIVIPGHMKETSIGHEKTCNPYVSR